MDGFLKRLRNFETTVMGTFAGGALYLTMNGAKIPQTKQEWGVFVVSAFLAGMGIVGKDGKTGSPPVQQ